MTGLKPCPFCGHETINSMIEKIESINTYTIKIVCNDCFAMIDYHFLPEDNEDLIETLEAAIEKWNRRANSSDN